MAFARLKLATQLLILVSGTALLTIVLVVLLAIFQARAVVQNEIDERVMSLVQTAAELVAPPLAARDMASVDRILKAMVHENALDSAFVFNSMGAVVAEQFDSTMVGQSQSFEDTRFAIDVLRDGQPRSRYDASHIEIAVPIVLDGRVLGVIEGQSSFEDANDEIAAAIPRIVTIGLIAAALAGLLALVIARYIASPLRALATAAMAVSQGRLEAPPVTRRGDEIGALTGAFAQMIVDLRTARAEVAAQQHTLEARVAERTSDLEQALTELRESTSARDQLSVMMRELSSPVVPVLEGILVMPLIGVIDSERAELLMDSLLMAIEEHHATIVIIDVTGVPLVDTHVARALIDASHAAQLLGAQTILVGLRPELAQTIVGLGIDLSNLVSRANLQSGVSYAIKQRQKVRASTNGR